ACRTESAWDRPDRSGIGLNRPIPDRFGRSRTGSVNFFYFFFYFFLNFSIFPFFFFFFHIKRPIPGRKKVPESADPDRPTRDRIGIGPGRFPVRFRFCLPCL